MPKIIFQPLMIANPPERLTEDRTYPALRILYFRNQDITQCPLPDCPCC